MSCRTCDIDETGRLVDWSFISSFALFEAFLLKNSTVPLMNSLLFGLASIQMGTLRNHEAALYEPASPPANTCRDLVSAKVLLEYEARQFNALISDG